MNLLFTWSGANLSELDRLDLEKELKKKLEGSLDGYWDKMRLATLREIDTRDLPKDLRAALKEAFGKLRMSEAGMKRLEILDRDEERFVNEMLFASIMPSTSSDLANLGNDLITNLAGDTISGNFTAAQLATMTQNIAKVLGISNTTTGNLLQAAVDSKVVQAAVGAAKMPEVLNRVRDVRSRLNDSAPVPNDNPQTSRPSLGDLYQRAQKDEAETKAKSPTHSTSSPKIQNARPRTPKPSGDSSRNGIVPFNSSSGTATSQARSIPTTPTNSEAATQPPPAKSEPKIEAAREIVDPRELLGGSYVFRNPKYTATDPLLQDKKHVALGDYGSKYFKDAQEASISAGSKIGSCDVKETRSDKLCGLEACKDAKPCKCLDGMLKTVQEFEMNPSGKDPAADVLSSRIQETGNSVEASVREALKKKYADIREKLKDPSLPDAKRKELLEGATNVEELEKRESVERSFYIKKVLLNGVMNTKTPACVLNKGRYGIGAKRDPATEPEWIFPGENYCHQFDIEPNEPFTFDPQNPGKGLSQQDAILLRLALKTLDGLEEANPKQLSKDEVLGGYETMALKTPEAQVCTSRSLCTLPNAVSEKPIFYRIFADESKDVRTRKLFDGETDNTIARTLLRCFGPREWGGMVIRMLEHLQPIAERCAVPAALALKAEIKNLGVLKAVCRNNENPALLGKFDIEEAQQRQLLASVESAKRLRNHLVFPFDRPKNRNLEQYCTEVKSRYSALLDILRGSTLLNPTEICSDERLKIYEKPTSRKDH